MPKIPEVKEMGAEGIGDLLGGLSILLIRHIKDVNQLVQVTNLQSKCIESFEERLHSLELTVKSMSTKG